MTRESCQNYHACGRVNLPLWHQSNTIDSSTDPTQDIPIKCIQMAANGAPINVKDLSKRFAYTNKSPEQLDIIDRRGTDKFDVFGQLRKEESALHDSLNNNLKHNQQLQNS